MVHCLVLAGLLLAASACSSTSDDATAKSGQPLTQGTEPNGSSGAAGNQNPNATETTIITPQLSANKTETGDGAEGGEEISPGKPATTTTLGSTTPSKPSSTKPSPTPPNPEAAEAIDVTSGDVFWRTNNQRKFQ